MQIPVHRVHVAISDKKELVYAILYKIPKEFPELMQGLIQFEGDSIEECHKQANDYFNRLVEIEEMSKEPYTVECKDFSKEYLEAKEVIESVMKPKDKKKK